MLTEFQKKCLKLAKESILEQFWNWNAKKFKTDEKEFNELGACFVTLKIWNDLRWCIGSIVPRQALKEDIIANAKNAWFSDPRFNSLSLKETQNSEFNIWITILSPIQEKKFKNKSELKLFLAKEKCWLIIKLWYRQATFLPSVWEELSDVDEFVKHLLYKAGIGLDEFENNFEAFRFEIYYGEEFKEKWRNI